MLVHGTHAMIDAIITPCFSSLPRNQMQPFLLSSAQLFTIYKESWIALISPRQEWQINFLGLEPKGGDQLSV